jgi:hypothetical protein
MGELGEEAEIATTALQDYIDTLKGMFDPQFAMIDALQSSGEAQRELRAATDELNAARASGDVDAVTAAEERYAAATSGARKSVIDLQSAANALKDSMDAQGLSAQDVADEFVALAMQQGFTKKESEALAAAFGITTAKANELGRTDPNVAISETGGSRVKGQLSGVQQAAINAGRQRPNVRVTTSGVDFVIGQLNRIPREITVRVNARMGQTVSGAIGGPTLHEGGYVGGRRGEEVAAILQAGERVLSLSEVDAMSRGVPVAGTGGGGAGGGTNIYVTVDARGSLNPNSREIASLVTSGLRQAGELGMPITVRGRSL